MDGLLGVAGMMKLLVIMDHSRKFPAFSTSKFLVMANWTPELCWWNPTNFLCWIGGLTAVNGFGPWTRSYRSQSKSRGATVNCSFLTPRDVLPEKQLKRIWKKNEDSSGRGTAMPVQFVGDEATSFWGFLMHLDLQYQCGNQWNWPKSSPIRILNGSNMKSW